MVGTTASAASEGALEAVLQHIDATITRDPQGWKEYPGGWPGQIGTALIDAIFSARATYATKRGRGIHAQVVEWSGRSEASARDLRALANEIQRVGPDEWAREFGNSQHSPGRRSDAPHGPTKAAAVLEAANALLAGTPTVASASDITPERVELVKARLRSVPGVGYATVNYFLMLLGRPGVKPDRMVHRFLVAATCRRWSDRAADELITAAAALLRVQPQELEHAIWKYESDRAAARTA